MILKDENEWVGMAGSLATSTLRAYRSDWRIFSDWCATCGVAPLPASAHLMAAFIKAEAKSGINSKTIRRRVAAIGYFHRLAKQVMPTGALERGYVAAMLAPYDRSGNRKRVANTSIICSMLEVIKGNGLRARRDRAILALGVSAGLRRSEIVAADIADVRFFAKSFHLTITSSSIDRTHEVIAIMENNLIQPVALLMAWVAAAGHRDGPLFCRLTRSDELTPARMSDRAIARLVQHYAERSGHERGGYSASSLRSGFLSEAANSRTNLKVRSTNRRRVFIDSLSEYATDDDLFENHAGASFL